MANFIHLAGLLLFASSTRSIIVPHFPRPNTLPLYNFQNFYNAKQLDRADEEKSRFQEQYGTRFDQQQSNHDYGSNGLVLPDEQPIHDFAEPPINNLEEEDDGSVQDSRFSTFQHGGHQHQHQHQHHYVQSVPVSQHVEVSRPVPVPVYKEIGVPVPHPVKINVPHPIAVGVPQPYPVASPVSVPVPFEVVRTVAVPVERKILYPLEKHIPVPVPKLVPIKIEKHTPIYVQQPYPIRVPVYKTIYHHAKRHYGR